MATSVNLNGATYSVPAVGEPRGTWGSALSSYLIAISTGTLQRNGGNQALSADLNTGSFGFVVPYIKSSGTNLATTGQVRLANNESIVWRNAANGADLTLKVNGSNVLEYNGTALSTAASAVTLTGAQTVSDKTLTNVAGITMQAGAPIDFAPGAASIGASVGVAALTVGGAGTSITVPGILKANILAVDADSVVINNDATSTGTSWKATLTRDTSGMSGNAVLTLPVVTDTIVGRNITETLTNKTLTAPVISTISNTGTITLPTSTDTLVGRATTDTLTNKTLTSPTVNSPSIANPTISTATTYANISTPTTPSAGFGKIYFKSDVPTYLDSSGNERVIANTAAAFANPMSAVGDLVYGGTAGAATRLAPNTTTTRKFLRETGTGSAGQAPVWDTLTTADYNGSDGTSAIAAGKIGEIIAATPAGVTQSSPVANTYYDDSGTLTLTPGEWDIHASLSGYLVPSSVPSGAVVAVLLMGVRQNTSALAVGTVASGLINGVVCYGQAGLTTRVTITTNTTYKISVKWAANSGSPTVSSIASDVGPNTTFYGRRVG